MIIPSGFGQCTIFFTGTGAPTGAACTWGFDHTGFADPDVVAAAQMGMFNTNIMPELCDTVSTTLCEVKFGPNDTGPVGTDAAGTAGGVAATSAPPNTAYLVSKRTALGGRANRGRLYLPGVDEADVSAQGTFGTTALQAAVDQWLTDQDTNQLPMVILHNDVGSPTPVTQLIVSNRVATQRRRLRR